MLFKRGLNRFLIEKNFYTGYIVSDFFNIKYYEEETRKSVYRHAISKSITTRGSEKNATI